MKAAKFIALILCITLINSVTYSQNQNSELEKLVQQAIEVSPQIKMLRAKQAVAENRVPQNSNLPDPTLAVGLVNLPTNTFSLTQEPMTGKMVALSQGFPFPGKLSAAEKVSSSDIDITKQEIIEKENEIRKKVTDAYFSLSFIRKAIQLNKDIKELFNNIADVAREKYSVASASQQDVFKVDLEITKVDDKIEDLKGKEAVQLATINTFLLRDVQTEVRTNSLGTITLDSLSSKRLKETAVNNRPMLKQIQLMEKKAKLMEDLSEYEFLPNFKLTLQYNQRDEIARTNTDLADFFSVMLGVTLPINYGGKKTAKVEETKSMQDLYRQQYHSNIQLLDISIESSIAKIKTLEKREQLIQDGFLNQANHSFNAALASYQVGKVDFINVIDALNKLLEIEINQYKIRTEYYKELSALQFITGDNSLIKSN